MIVTQWEGSWGGGGIYKNSVAHGNAMPGGDNE